MKPGLPQWALETFQEPVVRAYIARPRNDVTTYTFHTASGQRVDLFFPLADKSTVTVTVRQGDKPTAFDIMDADSMVPAPYTTREMLVHYLVYLGVYGNTPWDSSEKGAIQCLLHDLEKALRLNQESIAEIEKVRREYGKAATVDEMASMLVSVVMGIKKTRRLFK